MNLDEQGYPITVPSYPQHSRHPTSPHRMDFHQQPLRDHILRPTPRQYTAVPEFPDNYGNDPPPSMLQNTPGYPESSSSTIKEEQELNAYLYSPPDFRGEMNSNAHHPTHPDLNTIRYPPSHNPYPSSELNNPSTTGLAMPIGMTRLGSPEARLGPGPAETSSADFRYQMRALQSQQHQQHQRHQHNPLPHHQHQNHTLNHMQGSPTFFSPSMGYSGSLDQEHSSSPGGGALDRQPQTQLTSLEYDSREPHTQQHVSVPAMVYSSLRHEPMTVPGHSSSQQGVRHDATLNHHGGSLTSIKDNNHGSGSYHTTNSPSSIPMSNNKHNRGIASSLNTSAPGTHTSSSFSMGPSHSSRWVGHLSGFDMAGSTAGATSLRGQVPSTPAPASSSLRPILRHSDSGNRSSPETSFTQDNSRLRASTSAHTLSSSQSTHTHSPSPQLSDNESAIGGRRLGSEVVYPDDRGESEQEVDNTKETTSRMSKKSSAGKKKVMGAREEMGESFLAPMKKKKKSKMHRCEVCGKKFPRPSGLRTHMNTHNNEKPYPCGFPGCTRTFGVRSNAKRHLRTHGVVPTPAANHSPTDYVVGFVVQPAPPSSTHQQSQLHSVEGGEDLSGIRLSGDNVNIHTTHGQGQSDLQHEMSPAPLLKLRWMPPSLTTRTNARSLREVRDGQQVHGIEEGVEEDDGEDEDDFVGGSSIGGVRRMSVGGYDMDTGQDDIEDRVGDSDEVDFRDNIPRLSIRPIMPSSSNNSAAAASSSGIQLTMSRPVRCLCSSPCSESSTQGRCRSSPSSFTSISPVSSTSFARSNSSLSPPSMSAYGQRDIEMIGVGDGSGVYTRTGTISREYHVRGTHTEEQNSYLEGRSHPYHPSQHPKYFR